MDETKPPRYLALAVITSIVHGLVLFNDGIYGEDNFWFGLLQKHSFAALSLFRDRGVVADPCFWWLVGLTPHPVVTFKVIVFASVVGASLLLYWIAQRSALLSPPASFIVALLAISFPGFQTWPALLTSMYVFYAFLYVAAVACALGAEDAHSLSRIGLRIAAIVLFLCSFNLNSLLVLHYGILALLAVRMKRVRGTPPLRFLFSHADYALAPIVYRVCQLVLFAPRGQFVNQNRLHFSPASIASNTIAFVVQIVEDLENAGRFLIAHPLLTLLAVPLAISLRWQFTGHDHNESRFLAFGGLALIPFAIAPYVLVDKSPNDLVISTRHEILLAVPVAMIVTGMILWLVRQEKGRAIALTLAAVAFAGLTMQHYVAWQAWSIRQRAATEVLSDFPPFDPQRTIRINDQFVERPDIRFNSWLGAFPKSTLTANPASADLVVSGGRQQLDDLQLVMRYERWRLFDPSQLPAFFRAIIRIEGRA